MNRGAGATRCGRSSAAPYYQNENGWSALGMACVKGHEVAVRMLLEAK